MNDRTTRLPPLTPNELTDGDVDKYKEDPPTSVGDSLPPIKQTRTTATTTFVIPETPVVIATRNQTVRNNMHDLEDWKTLRLETSSVEVQKTKLEWENDIARHILSLYATTNALKNLKESNSLLDFVGEKDRPENKKQDEDPYKMHITTKRPNFSNSVNSYNLEEGEGSDDQNDSNAHSLERQESDEVPKTRRRKCKKKSNKLIQQGKRSSKSQQHRTTKEEQDRRNQEFINEIIGKIESSISLSKEKDKYRVTNAIKTKDGKEIVVRGSPRCYPIWFVSSGDVYVDWTGLVGGKQLQSHLSVLYENHYYDEYVNILQTMLLTFWREKNYGKEEFSVGSFGKSESTPNTPYSGSRNRTSSASTSKGKRSNNGSTTSSLSFSRPVSATSSNARSRDERGKLSRVSTANSEFALHYGGTPANASSQPPQVSFYDNLLAKEIDSSIRHEIEAKVEYFNAHRDQQRLPSSHSDQNTANEDDESPELSIAKISIRQIESFWKQLILTTVAIGIMCIERKQYDKGMKYFIKADEYSQNDDLIPVKIERKEYRALVKDAMSYYFFKREKFIAALAYSSQALEVFEIRGTNLEGIATCLLHIASTYCQMGKFKDSHKVLFQFLAMVENGRLALEDATPKQLCLVAVGYHNLAVVQLKLAMPDLACKSSQNARKIARLCLAYSNRWIDIFQYTHEIAVSDMKYELQSLTIDQITPEQMLIIKELAEALFSIDSQA